MTSPMPDDPLEEWRAIQEAEWERIINNEQVYGWEHHTAERLEKENRLLAAWEKERATFDADQTTTLTNAATLRAAVLQVAEEMERNECSIPSGHHKEDLVLDAQQIWAARLRKAAE